MRLSHLSVNRLAQKLHLFWALLLLFLSGVGVTAGLPGVVDGQPLPSLAPMLEKTTPSVVNIATRGSVQVSNNPLLDDPFFRQFFNVPQRSQRLSIIHISERTR